jgi:hypothetical protein
MTEIKKEFTKLIEQISNEITKFNDALEELPEIDAYYSELINDIKKEKKLPKKEAKKIALEILKKQSPKFIELLDCIDLLALGMEERIQETVDKLEDTQYKLEEIESMQSDIEDMKSELDI